MNAYTFLIIGTLDYLQSLLIPVLVCSILAVHEVLGPRLLWKPSLVFSSPIIRKFYTKMYILTLVRNRFFTHLIWPAFLQRFMGLYWAIKDVMCTYFGKESFFTHLIWPSFLQRFMGLYWAIKNVTALPQLFSFDLIQAVIKVQYQDKICFILPHLFPVHSDKSPPFKETFTGEDCAVKTPQSFTWPKWNGHNFDFFFHIIHTPYSMLLDTDQEQEIHCTNQLLIQHTAFQVCEIIFFN